MSTSFCQNLQRRLLETETGRLDAQAREHLRTCPACQAFAQDVSDSGPLLSSVARQVDVQAAAALPPALKSRVLAQIETKIAQHHAPGARVEDSIISKQKAGAGRRSRAWLEAQCAGLGAALGAALFRWRWAAAAGLFLLVAGTATLNAWQHRPLGRLEFAYGPATLGHDAQARSHEGLGQWAYQRGSTLSTPEHAAALFSLGEGVRAAMAEGTTLQVLEKEKLSLSRGAVWLSVTPGGQGFLVETPFARVRVTGTHFGVTVTDRETRVDVAEGSVAVSREELQGKVTAGQALTASLAGITAANPRQEGTNLPGWVDNLLTAQKLAYAGAYLPSIGKRQ